MGNNHTGITAPKRRGLILTKDFQSAFAGSKTKKAPKRKSYQSSVENISHKDGNTTERLVRPYGVDFIKPKPPPMKNGSNSGGGGGVNNINHHIGEHSEMKEVEEADDYVKKESDYKRTLMAESEFECTEIGEYLYVGGARVATSWDILKEKGITRIINCSASVVECAFADDPDIKYLVLNMVDGKQDDISWFMCEVINFIWTGYLLNEKTLLHCEKGISRSCSFAIAYGIWHAGCSFSESFKYIKARRRVCNPNSAFTCNLIEIDKLLNGDHRLQPLLFRCASHLLSHDAHTPVLKLCRDERNSRAIIPPATSLLDPQGVFVIRTPENKEDNAADAVIFIWKGSEASEETADIAKRLAGYMRGVISTAERLITINEGEETEEFYHYIKQTGPFDLSGNNNNNNNSNSPTTNSGATMSKRYDDLFDNNKQNEPDETFQYLVADRTMRASRNADGNYISGAWGSASCTGGSGGGDEFSHSNVPMQLTIGGKHGNNNNSLNNISAKSRILPYDRPSPKREISRSNTKTNSGDNTNNNSNNTSGTTTTTTTTSLFNSMTNTLYRRNNLSASQDTSRINSIHESNENGIRGLSIRTSGTTHGINPQRSSSAMSGGSGSSGSNNNHSLMSIHANDGSYSSGGSNSIAQSQHSYLNRSPNLLRQGSSNNSNSMILGSSSTSSGGGSGSISSLTGASAGSSTFTSRSMTSNINNNGSSSSSNHHLTNNFSHGLSLPLHPLSTNNVSSQHFTFNNTAATGGGNSGIHSSTSNISSNNNSLSRFTPRTPTGNNNSNSNFNNNNNSTATHNNTSPTNLSPVVPTLPEINRANFTLEIPKRSFVKASKDFLRKSMETAHSVVSSSSSSSSSSNNYNNGSSSPTNKGSNNNNNNNNNGSNTNTSRSNSRFGTASEERENSAFHVTTGFTNNTNNNSNNSGVTALSLPSATTNRQKSVPVTFLNLAPAGIGSNNNNNNSNNASSSSYIKNSIDTNHSSSSSSVNNNSNNNTTDSSGNAFYHTDSNHSMDVIMGIGAININNSTSNGSSSYYTDNNTSRSSGLMNNDSVDNTSRSYGGGGSGNGTGGSITPFSHTASGNNMNSSVNSNIHTISTNTLPPPPLLSPKSAASTESSRTDMSIGFGSGTSGGSGSGLNTSSSVVAVHTINTARLATFDQEFSSTGNNSTTGAFSSSSAASSPTQGGCGGGSVTERSMGNNTARSKTAAMTGASITPLAFQKIIALRTSNSSNHSASKIPDDISLIRGPTPLDELVPVVTGELNTARDWSEYNNLNAAFGNSPTYGITQYNYSPRTGQHSIHSSRNNCSSSSSSYMNASSGGGVNSSGSYYGHSSSSYLSNSILHSSRQGGLNNSSMSNVLGSLNNNQNNSGNMGNNSPTMSSGNCLFTSRGGGSGSGNILMRKSSTNAMNTSSSYILPPASPSSSSYNYSNSNMMMSQSSSAAAMNMTGMSLNETGQGQQQQSKPKLYQAVSKDGRHYHWEALGIYDDSDLSDNSDGIMLLSCAFPPSYVWFGKDAQLPLFSKHTHEIQQTTAHAFNDEELKKWAAGVTKPTGEYDFSYTAERQLKDGSVMIERSGDLNENFWNTFCAGF